MGGVIAWLRFGSGGESFFFSREDGLRQLGSWRRRCANVFGFDDSPEQKTYHTVQTLTGHSDWVRDVAWSPSVLLKSYIASASQDKTLRIWTTDGGDGGGQGESQGEWKCTTLEFDSVLWRASWSLSGNVLAVSQGDNKVSLWKENLGGGWQKIKDVEE